jgi:hypothetical protein
MMLALYGPRVRSSEVLDRNLRSRCTIRGGAIKNKPKYPIIPRNSDPDEYGSPIELTKLIKSAMTVDRSALRAARSLKILDRTNPRTMTQGRTANI